MVDGATGTASGQILEPTHLHDEHVYSSPLKVQTPLSFVDAQVFLLSAHPLLSIQDYEHVGVGSSAEHIAGVNLDLVRHD